MAHPEEGGSREPDAAAGPRSRFALAESIERAIAEGARRLPLFRGKQRVLRWLYPSEGPRCRPITGTVRTSWDLLFQFDTSSSIEWELFFLGETEQDLVEVIEQVVRPGWTCIDAGANIGTISLPLARAAGSGGAVYAFEPNPAVRSRLLANLRLNGLERVHLEEFCLGRRAGQVDFYVPPEDVSNVGQSSIYLANHPTMTGRVRKISVPILTLDEFVTSRSLTAIDMLKIDVEGAEIDVLQGAEETLRRFGPFLIFEANAVAQSMAGSNIAALIGEIERHGYVIHERGHEGHWAPMSEPERRRAGSDPTYFRNFIASRSPLPASLRA